VTRRFGWNDSQRIARVHQLAIPVLQTHFTSSRSVLALALLVLLRDSGPAGDDDCQRRRHRHALNGAEEDTREHGPIHGLT